MHKILLYTTLSIVVLISACSSNNSQTSSETSAGGSAAEAGDPVEGAAGNAAIAAGNAAMAAPSTDSNESTLRVVYLGDSITAGFGLGEEQAFPNLVQKKAEAAGFKTATVNAGISGDTSTGGLNRIEWLLKSRVDILILELGGNDGLRGIDLDLTRRNLSEIVTRTKATWPDAKIIIAGMMVPPNLGHEYTAEFQAIFPAVAKEHKATLIPFVLEGVGGIPSLNLPDGIHPTAEGHAIVANTIWKALKPILEGLS